MSDKYKHGDTVPPGVIAKRLDELSEAVTKGRDAVNREFTMRVPAELDRDADLVLSRAAQLARQVEALEDELFKRGAMNDAPCFCCGYNGPGYYQPDSHPCAERHHCLYKPEGL